MADIDLALNAPAVAGVRPTVQAGVAAADRYRYDNSTGRVMIEVSGGAAAATVTVHTMAAVEAGIATSNREIAIPAGETRLLGPYSGWLYNDGAGRVNLTVAADDASLLLQAIQWPA